MAYYIVIINPDTKSANVQRGTLLSLRGYEYLNDVTDALAWQMQGGFEISDYTTVTADPDLPGVMVCKVTGKPVMVDRGVFTTNAWAEFLKKTWGV